MAHKTCPNCGVSQPHDYIFCAECGTRLADGIEESSAAIEIPHADAGFDPDEFSASARHAAPEPAPARPAPAPAAPPAPPPATAPAHVSRRRVEWTLVHLSRAGGTSEPFPVPEDGLEVGTTGCSISFPDDRTMSARHASATPAGDGLQIEDAGSVNGIFIKISGAHLLVDGDVFVCGDSVFRFSTEAGSIAHDDFRLFAAPDEACPRGTITKLLSGGADGSVYAIGTRPIVIGRESADVSCPEDRYMSRVHAAVEPDNSGLFLKDKQSRNGTYIKTSGTITAHDGDVILVGRQLLRVEAKVQ